MKILFIHSGYWPYTAAATNRVLTDLTRYLATLGHEIHVICSGPNPKHVEPNSPTNQKVHDGVNIHRVKNLQIPALNIDWRSPINVLNFFLKAGILTVLWSYRFDIVITLDLPVMMGVWGTLARLVTLGKTRHVCWIMDMVTESRFQLGLWQTNNFLHYLIDYLHNLPYHYADSTIVLGQCMRERLLKRGVSSSRIQALGMWHYSNLIKPLPFGESNHIVSQKLSDKNKFVVMYSGYAGSAHTFQAVQDTIVSLREDKRIEFIFIGNSQKLLDIEAFAKDNSVPNFTRLDPFDWDDLSLILGAGHLHLVTLREDMQGICVPSKLYGVMAAGRPVLFIGPSQSQGAKDVLEANAGFVISPHDSETIASKIIALADNPSICEQMGSHARSYFLEHYDYPVRCRHWEEALLKLLV